MKYSINRALGELKLLDSRINTKIGQTTFVGVSKKALDNMGASKAKKVDFIADAKTNLQSIQDLIERRKIIKSKIVESNSSTDVVIGGKTMKVSEAIERKNSIQYEQYLANTLRTQYFQCLANVNKTNENVNVKLDELIIASLQKEKSKCSDTEIEIISNPYKTANEVEIVTLNNLDKKILEMENDISTFMAEVDYILSDSNSLNTIEIAD